MGKQADALSGSFYIGDREAAASAAYPKRAAPIGKLSQKIRIFLQAHSFPGHDFRMGAPAYNLHNQFYMAELFPSN